MRLIISALSCTLAGTVIAQAMPTDLDLRAAYCARVAAVQLAGMQQLMGGETPDSPAYAFVQKTLKDQANALNRLQSYLLPKLSSLDPVPLIAAARRADVDLEESKQVASVCAQRCEAHLQNGRPTQRWSACVDECAASPLVTRVGACRAPDWLPF